LHYFCIVLSGKIVQGPMTIKVKVTYLGFILVLAVFLTGCQITSRIEGEYYLNQEKYSQGVEKFGKKLKQDAFDAPSNYYMGRYLMALERPKEALPYIKEAVALDFKNAEYHFWHGVCFHELKRPRDERKSYLMAIKYDPGHLQAHLYLGHNYLDEKLWHKALKEYNSVLDLQRDQPQALYNKGLALNKLQRFSEEVDAWKDYLAYYPDGGWAIQAVDHLNARGNFEIRIFLIGYHRVSLKRIEFEGADVIFDESTKSSLDEIGSILRISQNISLKINGYKNGNKKLARRRAEIVKDYLINRYPDIESGRLTVSGTGSREKVQVGWKIFYLDDSLNMITTKK
jgi:tetratricopeptide (TPR) repeat protein